MCGIAGLLSEPDELDQAPGLVAGRMAERLTHRGPDDSGVFTEPGSGLGLGFRRLAILDLSPRGAQPMHSESGRFVVVFNGEIYNYRELREDLRSAGWSFEGDSDTEVLANAIERWGVIDAARRFVGMFALAVWDRRRETLCLLRDRMGVKPLHLLQRPGLFAFASELEALATLPDFGGELDRGALAAYLRHLYVPAPRSIYEEVSKLPPGHYVEVERPGDAPAEPEPYWSLDDVARRGRADRFEGSPEDAARELDRLLTDAVSLRGRADVPLGALLSGGLDSTTVVAYLQEQSANPVRTYTVGFGHDEHDESEHARAVAEYLGTDHTELALSGDRALDVVPSLPSIFDEPFADPSLVPTFLISRLASSEVTVALSGDGGDEIFGGYNRYRYGAPLLQGLSRAPRWLRAPVGRAASLPTARTWQAVYDFLAPLLPGEPRRLAGEKIEKLARLLEQDDARAMYRSLLSAWHRPTSVLRDGFEPEDAIDHVFGDDAAGDLLERMLLADQRQYLPDDLLAKVDRASMANSLEVRVPLLDHRIVEFAWRLPSDCKIAGGKTKRILREILYDRVPRRLVDRPKVGFSVPLADWLRGPLNEWARDLLAPRRLRRQGLFHVAPVQEALEAVESGQATRALEVWTVASFQNWLERQPGSSARSSGGLSPTSRLRSTEETQRSIRR